MYIGFKVIQLDDYVYHKPYSADHCTSQCGVHSSLPQYVVKANALDSILTEYLHLDICYSIYLIHCLPLSELYTLLCHLCMQMCHQPAQMETSGLLVEQATLKVVWRFVTLLLGALCVITGGEQLMQMWHVDNLDLVDQVNILNLPVLMRLLVGTCLRQEM